MPEKNSYTCNKCGLELNDHISDRFYAVNNEGKRIMCIHPAERRMAYDILGKNISEEEFNERTGVMLPYVCLDCAKEFQMDKERDQLQCPFCFGKHYEMVPYMGGKNCPRCKDGIIIKAATGLTV
jgi:DNA-directed RNA polymerase subunit RPC12/RpoP